MLDSLQHLSSYCHYLWRRVITILCFAGYASIGLILACLTLPIAYSDCRVPIRVQRWVRYCIHWLCRFLLWILNVTGCSQVCVQPSRQAFVKKSTNGQIFCANHPTYLDVVLLLSLVPDTLCIVKSASLKWPWSRSFVRLAGYVSNAQADVALQACVDALIQGEALILFPEGTRSQVNQLNPFQRGLANLVLRSEAEVVPVLLACQPLSLGKHQAWHQVPVKPYTMFVHALPSLLKEEWLEALRVSERPIQVRVRELNKQFEFYFNEKLNAYGYLRNTN